MKVCFASYQSVSFLKGGPRTQILQTKHCLEELGVSVNLFDSWKNFRKEDFELVHLFGANIGTYHLAREFNKLGIPMIVTPIFFSMHSPYFIRAGLFMDRLVRQIFRGFWIDYGMLNDICTWSKAVLPNTNAEADLLQRGLKIEKEKIEIIPNGADKHFQYTDGLLFKQMYSIENFILNVGHIGPGRKNVLRLIQALEGIHTPAVIIGRIEDNIYGRECVKLSKKNPNLLLIDSIPNDSELLASAYAACDVFVLPSLFETPGIAALEAALAGAKIVITKYGGTDEYFKEFAEYVEPKSVDSIRDGILKALLKKKTNGLSELIKKDYLWEKVAEKTKSVYKKVLQGL